MITFKQKGNYSRTINWMDRVSKGNYLHSLEKYGQLGVDALSAATPKDTGLTSSSWEYEIIKVKPGKFRIEWRNTNINKGVPIAVIIQYGHGTGTGGYVEGIDYINPALKPVFDAATEEIWGEVVRE